MTPAMNARATQSRRPRTFLSPSSSIGQEGTETTELHAKGANRSCDRENHPPSGDVPVRGLWFKRLARIFQTQHGGRDAGLRRPRAVQARNVRPSARPPSHGERTRFRRCTRRGQRSAPSLPELVGLALSKREISGLGLMPFGNSMIRTQSARAHRAPQSSRV